MCSTRCSPLSANAAATVRTCTLRGRSNLDLVLFGDLVIDEPGLTVPHPRFRERRFVLEPLAAVAPDLVDPVTGSTVGELLARAL